MVSEFFIGGRCTMRIATKVSNTITLGDTIEKFMIRKKADSLAKKTMDDYRRELNRFLKSSSHSMDVRVLEDEVIKYFGNIPMFFWSQVR